MPSETPRRYAVWVFVVPYLCPLSENASQRVYDRLSETRDELRYVAFSMLMLHKAASHFRWSSE